MLCTSPPPASPAGSEISVGAPSPPPPNARPLNMEMTSLRKSNASGGGEEYFQPLKRLRMAPVSREASPSPPPASHQQSSPPTSQAPAPSHRSSIDGIKSFSIVDILGRESPTPPPPSSKLNLVNSPPNGFHLHPYLHHPALAHSFELQHHHHNQSHPSSKIVRPWDHLRGPVPVRPFLPPALLHYEHRLALDYQRQIHEHLNAQAELLRHMSMDIIPSESGSERSSSAASDCCSPEILNRSSVDGHQRSEQGNSGSSSSAAAAAAAGSKSGKSANGTPLDALFQMTSKTFDEQQNESSSDQSHLNLFSNRPQTKKKRKSRTAFTNHQIFELEKRFLYQKYLSPADRDEIALSLGLSNAQVITWFQNRRAKLKRDMEELKKDVETVKAMSQKSFLESVNDLGILKKKVTHDEHMAQQLMNSQSK